MNVVRNAAEADALPDKAIILGGKLRGNGIPWRAWTTAARYGSVRKWTGAVNDQVIHHTSDVFEYPAFVLFDPTTDTTSPSSSTDRSTDA